VNYAPACWGKIHFKNFSIPPDKISSGWGKFSAMAEELGVLLNPKTTLTPHLIFRE
jgi:hypothetical protein